MSMNRDDRRNSVDLPQDEAELERLVTEIRLPDAYAQELAKERQDSLAKVPGSLGKLEEISVRIAGITGKVTGNSLKKQCVALFCADNGVSPKNRKLLFKIATNHSISPFGSRFRSSFSVKVWHKPWAFCFSYFYINLVILSLPRYKPNLSMIWALAKMTSPS